MKHYMIHIPGMVYAFDQYGDSERDALNRYKSNNDLYRMPKGYAIWEA